MSYEKPSKAEVHMILDAWRTLHEENKRMRETLETLSAQHSGVAGSTKLSDCMAVMARNALQPGENDAGR